MKKTFYVRLLTYNQALKLVNYVNNNSKFKDAYAHITVGGVTVNVDTDLEVKEVTSYLENTGWRHEITEDHPTKVTKRIIQDLKDQNIIKDGCT